MGFQSWNRMHFSSSVLIDRLQLEFDCTENTQGIGKCGWILDWQYRWFAETSSALLVAFSGRRRHCHWIHITHLFETKINIPFRFFSCIRFSLFPIFSAAIFRSVWRKTSNGFLMVLFLVVSCAACWIKRSRSKRYFSLMLSFSIRLFKLNGLYDRKRCLFHVWQTFSFSPFLATVCCLTFEHAFTYCYGTCMPELKQTAAVAAKGHSAIAVSVVIEQFGMECTQSYVRIRSSRLLACNPSEQITRHEFYSFCACWLFCLVEWRLRSRMKLNMFFDVYLAKFYFLVRFWFFRL